MMQFGPLGFDLAIRKDRLSIPYIHEVPAAPIDSIKLVRWNTRIVPFGPDISSAIFALGFANRAAMAFGNVQPGDYKKMLLYNKDRIFAFVNALGDVGSDWAGAAAGCVNWGFPTLADTDIPEVLPTGICTYEHVVANVPHDEIVQKSVEVRGLKVTVSDIDIPLSFGPAYEGERVRGSDLFCQMGGGKTQCTELAKIAEMNDIEDGKVEVVGKDLTDIKEGENLPLGIYVQIAGREFQEDSFVEKESRNGAGPSRIRHSFGIAIRWL